MLYAPASQLHSLYLFPEAAFHLYICTYVYTCMQIMIYMSLCLQWSAKLTLHLLPIEQLCKRDCKRFLNWVHRHWRLFVTSVLIKFRQFFSFKCTILLNKGGKCGNTRCAFKVSGRWFGYFWFLIYEKQTKIVHRFFFFGKNNSRHTPEVY